MDTPAQTAEGRPSRAQARLESVSTATERPLRRLVGSSRANPLPHSGAISVFLLAVVTLTGIYITLFYEYGFSASYDAVAEIHDHPVQRFMRTAHRYASAALVVTTLVHAWRIFVAGRFTGARRFRWLTGVAALLLVWLAGVTGYWLVWDVRAQALGEALERVVGDVGWGAAFVVGKLVGSGAGSGAGLMVFVWFVHLLLTAVIAWFLWRHLRASRLPWLPPRHWMVLMGGGLVLVSLALPAELLDPGDPARLVPDMPLDPFMLFLLPLLLSDQAVLVMLLALAVAGAIAIVPWVLRDRTIAVVEIDDERCTGCELCAVDCPYLALDMRSRPDGSSRGSLAVVDAKACVGCGICLGSCSFGAITMHGHEAVDHPEPAGKAVIVACRRHVQQQALRHEELGPSGEVEVVEVQCTGMFHPQAVGDLVSKGATSVQIIGCAPGECAYGIGNEITSQRLGGSRAPHVSRAYAGVATEDYVALGDLARATDDPGGHPATDRSALPDQRRVRAAAALVTAVSLMAIAAATLLPFGGESGAAVRIVVDHEPGRQLIGQLEPSGSAGDTTEVLVEVDGAVLARQEMPTSGSRAVGVVDVDVEPGEGDLRVALIEGVDQAVLYAGPARFVEGRRFLIEARDVPPPPGVAEGKRVFNEPRLGGCGVCHSTSAGDDGVGPSLAGVAKRAATTVPGLSAEEYLTESVLEPDAYIVPGWPAGQMLPIYADRLSDDEVSSLISYLLTLEDA